MTGTWERGHGFADKLVRLPHGPGSYVRAPRDTWGKILAWVRARWYLRRCTRVGSWTRVTGRVFVQNGGDIVIGERVLLVGHFSRPGILSAFAGGRLEIGDRTFINYGADIAATKLVRIGADCFIGSHVIILDNGFHTVGDYLTAPEGQPVTIGDRVWIGNRVTILPGVTIGDDAVIGAGSIVTRDVPLRTIAAGNPARVLREQE